MSRFILAIPRDLSGGQLASFLGLASRSAAAKRSVIIVGTTITAAEHLTWIEIERRFEGQILSMLQTSLPGVRVSPAERSADEFTLVGSLRLSTNRRPLATDAVTAVGLAAFGTSLRRGERVQWQLMLSGARSPRPVHAGEAPEDALRVVKTVLGMPRDPFIRDGRDRADLVAKHKRPLVNALGTLAVRTAATGRDRSVMSQALAHLRSVEAPGVRVVLHTRWQRIRQAHLERRRAPLFEWPLHLNLDETVALLGWPTTETTVTTASQGHARWMAQQPTKGLGVAVGFTQNARGATTPLVLPDGCDHMFWPHLSGL